MESTSSILFEQRHRGVVNFQAEAEGVAAEKLIVSRRPT